MNGGIRVLVAAPFSWPGSGLRVAAEYFCMALEQCEPGLYCDRVDSVGGYPPPADIYQKYDIGIHFGSPAFRYESLAHAEIWASALMFVDHFVQFIAWEASPLPNIWSAAWSDRRINSFLVPSNWVKDLVTQVTAIPTHVVPHGVSEAAVPYDPFSQDRFTVLHVGQATPRKGLSQAVAAFVRELGTEPECAFVAKSSPVSFRFRAPEAIVEESVLLNAPDPLRAKMDIVSSPLPPSGVYDMYNRASVLLFNSAGEGFGLPAVEAMMHGLPVIYTNWSGLAEVCKGLSTNLPLSFHLDEAVSMRPFGYEPRTQYAVPQTRDIMDSLRLTYQSWCSQDASLLDSRDSTRSFARSQYGLITLREACAAWLASIGRG